jgi:hypothetical protein
MSKGIPPTVGNFFVVLSSLLTQYDAKEEARARKSKYGHHNIYALSHYFNAMHEAEEDLLKHVKKDEPVTEEIAGMFVQILAEHFTVNHRSNEFDLPPLRKFVKQLEAFVSSGKNPTLIDR